MDKKNEDKYIILDNNREITNNNKLKPIEELLIEIKSLSKEISSIRTDMAITKNRLFELIKEKERISKATLVKKHNEDNINAGWGWGFF